jgi:sec-independent protein translocase protein TatA
MNLGSFEIVIILVLALLLYGRRLPEISKAVGKGYKSFKKEIDGIKDELSKVGDIKSLVNSTGLYPETKTEEPNREEKQVRPEAGLTVPTEGKELQG